MPIDLGGLDIEVLVDKSGSMSKEDCPGGRSRWKWVQEQTEAFAREAAKVDTDGITVGVFDGTPRSYEGVGPAKVEQIFSELRPAGSTNTAGMIKQRLDAYFADKAAGRQHRVGVEGAGGSRQRPDRQGREVRHRGEDEVRRDREPPVRGLPG